jgi:hypothetical protein
VSPSEDSQAETLSTLKFASRAKMIKNKAVVNEDSEGGSLADLRRELSAAREQLSRMSRYHGLSQSTAGAPAGVGGHASKEGGSVPPVPPGCRGGTGGTSSQREAALVEEKQRLEQALSQVTDKLQSASEAFEVSTKTSVAVATAFLRSLKSN